jgi:hypothetical protein
MSTCMSCTWQLKWNISLAINRRFYHLSMANINRCRFGIIWKNPQFHTFRLQISLLIPRYFISISVCGSVIGSVIGSLSGSWWKEALVEVRINLYLGKLFSGKIGWLAEVGIDIGHYIDGIHYAMLRLIVQYLAVPIPDWTFIGHQLANSIKADLISLYLPCHLYDK